MKYCTKCEGELIRGLKYCFHCGADVNEVEASSVKDTTEKKENEKVANTKKNVTKSRLDTRLFEII